MNILSIEEIIKLLHKQSALRSLENDEAGILTIAAICLEKEHQELKEFCKEQ